MLRFRYGHSKKMFIGDRRKNLNFTLLNNGYIVYQEQLNMIDILNEIYEDKLVDLIPSGIKLMNKVPKNNKELLYYQPVILGMEHGVDFKKKK